MTIKVLFVDDEPRVIRGIRRMLIDMADEWNMFFAGGGEEALSIFEKESIDVIVSDMRMPGMDGGTLLKKVMENHPDTIRIILSGYSEQELIMKTVNVAHQFLAKPSDAETLQDTIKKAINLRKRLKNEFLVKLVTGITRMPVLPDIYNSLLDELQKKNFSMKVISEIIKKDVTISAHILKLVNSAFFGLPRKVSNIEEAVNFLGINIIKSLIIFTDLFSSVDIATSELISVEKFNEHSMNVANLAKLIAFEELQDKGVAEKAFMAGMLHDIGMLMITRIAEKSADAYVAAEKLYPLLPQEYLCHYLLQ